ncbi:MAG: helix-turn-helix domain-containing protein [Pseudomonadota bacterium]
MQETAPQPGLTPAPPSHHWATQPLDPLARWDGWRTALADTHLPWAIEPRMAPARFQASLQWRPAQDLSLVACHCLPCAGQRSAREIRQSNSAALGLLLVVAGEEAVCQGEVSALLKPGDLFLWDSQRPLRFEVRAPLSKVTLLIGREEAEALLPKARAPLHLQATRPEAALLAGYLSALSRYMGEQEAQGWEASMDSALDLLATAVRAGSAATPRARQAARVSAIKADIRRHAKDPRLTPAWLAARHRLSLRSLHALLEEEPESVGQVIRKERLDGARRDLQSGSGVSVSEVAYAWCFSSPAHFSRAFRAEFGMAPRELRSRSEFQPVA